MTYDGLETQSRKRARATWRERDKSVLLASVSVQLSFSRVFISIPVVIGPWQLFSPLFRLVLVGSFGPGEPVWRFTTQTPTAETNRHCRAASRTRSQSASDNNFPLKPSHKPRARLAVSTGSLSLVPTIASGQWRAAPVWPVGFTLGGDERPALDHGSLFLQRA